MSKIRKVKNRKSKLETQIVEDAKVLSSYGYCEIPAHFFDRALQTSNPKKTILTVAPWKDGNASAR
ncbi:MAG: hypothetical protein J0M12_10245 [Deltaproteobacteria bacterium]|nr:hypothetical protein [Deltaproteobacteria bacterium]